MSKVVYLFIVVMLLLSNAIIKTGSFKCRQNMEDFPFLYGMIGPYDRAEKIYCTFSPDVDGYLNAIIPYKVLEENNVTIKIE